MRGHEEALLDGGAPGIVNEHRIRSALARAPITGTTGVSTRRPRQWFDESPSDVLENADLVHVVAVEDIHATVRQYHLSLMADSR